MNDTAAERQQTFRERMARRGYTQVCEWVPNRDVAIHKYSARVARETYADLGEPDAKVKNGRKGRTT